MKLGLNRGGKEVTLDVYLKCFQRVTAMPTRIRSHIVKCEERPQSEYLTNVRTSAQIDKTELEHCKINAHIGVPGGSEFQVIAALSIRLHDFKLQTIVKQMHGMNQEKVIEY